MQLLGIDNVFFEVGAIDEAIELYTSLGFQLKFKIPHLPGALFNIGNEDPGLLLRQSNNPKPSCLWIEVENAHEIENELSTLGIHSRMIEAATGLTIEVTDQWGNRIGFADYTKKPELARKPL